MSLYPDFKGSLDDKVKAWNIAQPLFPTLMWFKMQIYCKYKSILFLLIPSEQRVVYLNDVVVSVLRTVCQKQANTSVNIKAELKACYMSVLNFSYLL